MLEIKYEQNFMSFIGKIRDESVKTRIKKQIIKIISSPEIGKPMKYERKETREVYVSPFRISYGYFKKENILVFIDIYHKDKQ